MSDQPVSTAIQAEAIEETTVDVEWRGEKFQVPLPDYWSWDVIEAFDDGKISHALKALLSPKQYRKWKSLLGPQPTHDSGEFMDVLGEALGVDPGE